MNGSRREVDKIIFSAKNDRAPAVDREMNEIHRVGSCESDVHEQTMQRRKLKNRLKVPYCVDTGADRTVVSHEYVRQLQDSENGDSCPEHDYRIACGWMQGVSSPSADVK